VAVWNRAERPVDINSRNGFLNLAATFEGGILFVGLCVAWLTGVSDEIPFVLRWQDVGWGLAAILPMFIAYFAAPDLREQVRLLLGKALSECRWYDLVGLAALAGLGEEILFRGAIQTWLARWDPWNGLLLTSVLFGLAHAVSLRYFLFATIVGLYFGWLYVGVPGEPYGIDPPNLLRPIIAHGVYDYIAFLLIVRDYRREHVRSEGAPGGRSDGTTEQGP
jgi:membrane protease YdiL (CAAX protease family)